MFVYHRVHIGKVVICSYIITTLDEGCYMFVYQNAPLGKMFDVGIS